LSEPETRSGQIILRIPLEKLRGQGPLGQRYVLRAALSSAGMRIREVTHRRVERIRDLMESHRRGVVVKLSDGASVMLDDSNVVITVTHEASEPEAVTNAEFEITRDGRWVADVDKGTVSRVTAEMITMPEGGVGDLLSGKPQEIEYLDAEAVLFPLFMRGRKDGDRLQPLGMDGEKKIHDIFIDNKLPREERDLVPLVCDSNGVVIVAGQCIANRARVKPTSRQILKVTMVPRNRGPGSSGWLPPVT
ncbi:MAG: tRNA lysidine(34) synthetase TilS, partial [Planctomycetota bacterium]|jgi:tRNA(Ile)-lysidine synthase